MMKLDFHTIDVFTEHRFGGNPLAVVHGADDLDTEAMQLIAREFNLSETVFVLKPQNPMHSARTRLFTPMKELPFAGHPTVGTAALLAELKQAAGVPGNDALIVIEQQIGTLRVGVRMRAGAPSFAEFDAPRLPVEAGALPPVDVLAAGLGLIPSEIGFENHRPVCFAAGNAFAFVPVASLEALERARINGADWSQAFEEQGLVGAYLYTRQCVHTASAFHARMFAPAAGVPEDPATGSAAVCLAGVVDLFDDLPDGNHKKVVEQGFTMGRPSFITLSLTVTAGKLSNVRIGGHVVRVSEGVLEV
ncbi:MAG: PhzF family phenazine biosynthesis protein [Hyphomicrobium sp.]|nr:PhzF family phenazine biosynthesis protein [Hyphomicrobium sp.]